MRIDEESAYGGLLALGPMGSGKTRAVLQPWAGWWLRDPTAGLFAYGVKPNWSASLVAIALAMGREPEQIHVVGPGYAPWPLIRGLEPDSVANFVREAFRREGAAHGGDQFFSDSATNLVRRAAAILYYSGQYLVADTLSPTGDVVRPRTLGYDLESISEIVHATGEDANTIAAAVRARASGLEGEAAEDLEAALAGYERLTKDLPEKTRGSVVGQIDTVVEPFLSSRALRTAFCSNEEFDLESALVDGGVVVLDVDLGRYAAAARLVYLLAFEQMRRLMIRRIDDERQGHELDPVAFVADEYAEVATAAHKSMWRLCREARIAPVIAYQLHSDLRSVVGGKDAADALVAGMRTKVLFATDDEASVQLAAGALGQVDREYESTSRSTSHNSGLGTSHHGAGGGGGSWNSGTSTSESTSTAIQQRYVVDAQVMQSLRSCIRRGVPVEQQQAEAVYLGDHRGCRIADVVRVRAWDPPEWAAERAKAMLDGDNGREQQFNDEEEARTVAIREAWGGC